MVTDREILEAVLAEVRGLGTRMDGLESRMDGLDSRMDGLDSRMDGLDSRMNGLDARMDGLDSRMREWRSARSGLRKRPEIILRISGCIWKT